MPSIEYIMNQFSSFTDDESNIVITQDEVLEFLQSNPLILNNIPYLYDLEDFIGGNRLPTDDKVRELVSQFKNNEFIPDVNNPSFLDNEKLDTIDENKAYLYLFEQSLNKSILTYQLSLTDEVNKLQNKFLNQFEIYDNKQRNSLLTSIDNSFKLLQQLDLKAELNYNGKDSYFSINNESVNDKQKIKHIILKELQPIVFNHFLESAKNNNIELKELPYQDYDVRYNIFRSLSLNNEDWQKIQILVNPDTKKIEWTYSTQIANLDDETTYRLFKDFDNKIVDFKYSKLSKETNFFDGLNQLEKLWQDTLLSYDNDYERIKREIKIIGHRHNYQLSEPQKIDVTLYGSDNNRIVLNTFLTINERRLNFKDIAIDGDINEKVKEITQNPYFIIEILGQLFHNKKEVINESNQDFIDIKNKCFNSEDEYVSLTNMIQLFKEIDIYKLIHECKPNIPNDATMTEKELSQYLVENIVYHDDFMQKFLNSNTLKNIMDNQNDNQQYYVANAQRII